jgi:hypothetical protein
LGTEKNVKQIQKKTTELARSKLASAEERKKKETQIKQIAEFKATIAADMTRQIEKGKKVAEIAKQVSTDGSEQNSTPTK